MDAIIYIRFSTLEQTEGASIDRQLERCTALCEEHGWNITATMIDAGKSAFHAAHREAGAKFAAFEAEAVTGMHAGKVLVVERLSRLSRQDYEETIDLMRSMTRKGLSIATWDGNKLYEAGKPIDFVSVIEMLVKIKTAHEESRVKSDFGKDKWERRRKAAADGKIATANGPPWLKINKARTGWIEIADRVKLVQRMFAMCDAGDGSLIIARTLNQEKIAPWPRYQNRTDSARNRVPTAWDRGFISRILANPAVIGDYVMHSYDATRKLVPVGEPIRGYFPRIVDADVFERVNAAAPDRKMVRGRTSRYVANLVSGLAVCGECNGVMLYGRGRAAGSVIVKNGVPQAPLPQETAALQCKNNMRAEGCTNKARVAYIGFERALLDSTLHLAMDDAAFQRNDEVGRLTLLIVDRRRDLDAATNKAKTLWTGYAASGSDMAMQLAKAAEDDAAAIQDEIKTLGVAKAKASGEASAAEHLSRLAEVRSHLYSPDIDLRRTHRSKVAAGLRGAVDRVVCEADRTASVFLKVGGMVRIEPGMGRRPAKATFFNTAHTDRDHSYLPVKEQAIIGRIAAAK